MGDAWIYAQRGEAAEEAARMLAELGFSPRRVAINGSLRPPGEAGATAPRPDLAMVLDDRGDATPLCTRLREDEELGGVPIVVSVEPDDLELNPEMLEVHELIVAPFTAAELSARIARARRAVHGIEEDEVVRSDELELNLATYQVRVDGEPVDFTYMEYELLKFLLTHPRRAFSREALLSQRVGLRLLRRRANCRRACAPGARQAGLRARDQAQDRAARRLPVGVIA
jgi:DNA-binding response OmpR family regulator